MNTIHKNKETQTFVFKNATVRVHRPELTAEERERRIKQIHDATARFLKEISNG